MFRTTILPILTLMLLMQGTFAKKISPKIKSTPTVAVEKVEKQNINQALYPDPAQTPWQGLPLDIQVDAPIAYLIDFDTGAILLTKNHDKQMHPSSMTKIMTAYLVVDKIKKGVISPDTLFTVSKNGWRVEGSSMFLNIDEQVKVIDLLKGLIIQSGNDASVILAEGCSGTEGAFAAEMNRKAKELGATQTHFVNANGLPHPEHLTTAQDLAIISTHVIKDQGDYYHLYREKDFIYNNIKQGNRNPLLYKDTMGCDGIKTGSSQIAGYGMVASCVQESRRLILVINGLKSMQARSDEAVKLMTWGFRTFTNKTLVKENQVIAELPVRYGVLEKVTVTSLKDLTLTLPRSFEQDLKISYDLPKELRAPLVKGDCVGKVIITSQAFKDPLQYDLVAAYNVERAGFFKRMWQSITYLFGKKE